MLWWFYLKEIKENHMKMDQSLVKIKTEASGQSLDNISCASSSSSSSTDSNGSQKSMLSNSSYSYSMEDITSTGKAHDGPEIHEVKVVFVKYPDECCPKCCSKKCGCFAAFDRTMVGRYWGNFRFFMFKLVENNYFETFIIIMIVTSSLALVCSYLFFLSYLSGYVISWIRSNVINANNLFIFPSVCWGHTAVYWFKLFYTCTSSRFNARTTIIVKYLEALKGSFWPLTNIINRNHFLSNKILVNCYIFILIALLYHIYK